MFSSWCCCQTPNLTQSKYKALNIFPTLKTTTTFKTISKWQKSLMERHLEAGRCFNIRKNLGLNLLKEKKGKKTKSLNFKKKKLRNSVVFFFKFLCNVRNLEYPGPYIVLLRLAIVVWTISINHHSDAFKQFYIMYINRF